MDRLMAEESWGTIVLDVDAGQVLLRQDWYYRWLIHSVPAPLHEDLVGRERWTAIRKEEIHLKVQAQIRAAWERPVRLTVSGIGEVAQRLRGRTLTFHVDIHWTDNPLAHWTVNMWMTAPDFNFGLDSDKLDTPHYEHMWPSVRSASRIITLNLSGMNELFRMDQIPLRPRHQHAVAHEFGHTLGTSRHPHDEYAEWSPHIQDRWSIMNAGMEIRARHLASVVEVLHRLAPGAEFEVITNNTER